MNNYEKNNVVRMLGTVDSELVFSHEVYGEGFYNFKILVKRLSETYDTLVVTVSERIIDLKDIVQGQIIEVCGQIRSYNNYTNNVRENKLVLNLFAKEILCVNGNDMHRHNNEVELIGYICKTPIYRETPFGREIADVLLAVNRHYNKSDYIPCIIWGKNAKFISKLDVGSKLKVWGRLQSRAYQKRLENGEIIDKSAYEVSISKLEVLRDN